MTGKNSRSAGRSALFVGFCLAAGLLVLAGCADTPKWGSWSQVPTKTQITAALRQSNTYIYFSNYQIYQQPARHEYVFWDGRAWVTSNQPPVEVSADLLDASPKVELTFSDHPAKHHAEVARRYPRDWRSPESFVVANP